MGMFNIVCVESGVELPYFPEWVDVESVEWTTKDLGRLRMKSFKVTSDGRLLEEQEVRREMTEEERQEYAESYDYPSWEVMEDAFRAAVESDDPLDAVMDLNRNDDGVPPLVMRETTVEEVYWEEREYSGRFEIHKKVDGVEFPLSYELQFTRGELDQVVFLGDASGQLALEETKQQLK